jgi:hypothetical protein
MVTDPWQFGLLAVLITTNVAVSYWLYRRLRASGGRSSLDAGRDTTTGVEPEPPANEPTATGHEQAVVTCSACGTTNDPTYRFCRACVAELSAPGTVGSGADDRAGGLPR